MRIRLLLGFCLLIPTFLRAAADAAGDAAFERFALRRVHQFGHVPELLVTFGLSYLILELVQLIWGRATVPYALPTELQGPLFSLYGTQFPKSRSFIMLVAVLMPTACTRGYSRRPWLRGA